MPTDHILALLIAERDKLNRAIEALQGTPRRGRPRKNPLSIPLAPAHAPTTKRKGWTAAKRKAAAERAKAVWAKRRKKSGKKG